MTPNMGGVSKFKNHSFLDEFGVNHISYDDPPLLSDDAHPTLTLDAFLPEGGTGSPTHTHRVYLDISTTNEGHQPEGGHGDSDNFIWYDKYKSILSRFEYEGFADLDRLALELREISKKLRWIDRRLSKDFIDDKERKKLLSLKSRYVRLSQKLLNALSKSVNLYADRFFVDVPSGYGILLRKLGYTSDKLSLHLWFNKGVLEVLLDDNSSHKFDFAYISKVRAGKYHPVKGISKGSQEAKRVLRDLLILSEMLEGNLLSYRKGSVSTYVTTHNLIPIRHIILTAPKELSYAFWRIIKGGDSSVIKVFRSVTAKTLNEFLTYLASKERISGKLLFGFTVNVHVTGDKNPFEPHVHSDCIVTFICFDKKGRKWYRLNPLLNEDDLKKLRELWKNNVIAVFGELLSDDTKSKDFDVWVGDNYYSLPLDVAQVFFELKYASRKLFVNFANFFEVNNFDENSVTDWDFVKFVFSYENRTERYGFLTNIRRYLRMSCSDIVDKRIKELEQTIKDIEFDFELNRDVMGDKLREALLDKLNSLKNELDKLKSGGFDYLLESVQSKVEEMLSKENITKERIISILNVLFKAQNRHIINFEFYVEYEDIPLWELLDFLQGNVLILGDRHPSVEFIFLRGGDICGRG